MAAKILSEKVTLDSTDRTPIVTAEKATPRGTEIIIETIVGNNASGGTEVVNLAVADTDATVDATDAILNAAVSFTNNLTQVIEVVNSSGNAGRVLIKSGQTLFAKSVADVTIRAYGIQGTEGLVVGNYNV